MGIYIKKGSITVSDGEERLDEVITAVEGRKTDILSVTTDAITGIDIIVKIDEEELARVPTDLVSGLDGWLPVPNTVEAGKTVKIGYHNQSGGAETLNYALMYKEETT